MKSVFWCLASDLTRVAQLIRRSASIHIKPSLGRSNAKSRFFCLVLMSNIHPAKVESDTLYTDPASVLAADTTSTHTDAAISTKPPPYLAKF